MYMIIYRNDTTEMKPGLWFVHFQHLLHLYEV